MVDFKELADCVIKGDAVRAEHLTNQAINEKIAPRRILNEGLIAGMDVVGVKFRSNEYYLPEVLVSARAMSAGLKLLKPLLEAGGTEPTGNVVIGTVKGDLHDIGKNIVGMMLTGAGFNVVDLGADVDPQRFVEKAKGFKSCIVGMSALLTTTMLNMRATIVALEEAGLREHVKVIVGGAPVSEGFAREINADAYAQDATTGVDLAKKFVKELGSRQRT